MLRFSANLSMLFQEYDFLERFDKAAACGFRAVEFMFPYDYAPILSSARPTISVTTQQMNSSRQNRSERSQQTQRPVFPARDMLCENPHICG